VKYWDSLIIIGKRKIFWKTAGVYLFFHIISLLEKRKIARNTREIGYHNSRHGLETSDDKNPTTILQRS
jgi:hypothetical protein